MTTRHKVEADAAAPAPATGTGTTTAARPRPVLGELIVPKAPEVVEDQLPGGLRLLAVSRPTIPIVELRLGFPLSASVIQSPAAPMVLTESMFAGTEGKDRSAIAAAVERLGGALAVSFDHDRLVIGASALAEHLDELLDLLTETLVGATYTSDEVKADRERVADETLIAFTQPEVIASEALRRRMHVGHPYAVGLPSPNNVRRVSATTLRELHVSALGRQDGYLVLVGDLDPATAAASAAERLGPWLTSPAAAPVGPLPPLRAAEPRAVDIVDRPGSVQSNILVGSLAPTRRDDWWPAAMLANLAFGGLFASRLVVNLREKHGYSYSPRSGISHHRAGSTHVVRAEVGSEVTAAALAEIRYELARAAVSGIGEDELEAARRYAVGSLAFLTATQSGLASTLSSLCAGNIGPGYLESHAAALARATKAEVDEAARRLLAPSGGTTIVVGDASVTADALRALDAVEVGLPPSY
jgi:zinc protease